MYNDPRTTGMENAYSSLSKVLKNRQPAPMQTPGVSNSTPNMLPQTSYNKAPVDAELASLGSKTTDWGGSTRYEKFHPGVDIANAIGTPIRAFTSGVVSNLVLGKKQGEKGYGNQAVVADNEGNQQKYSHLLNSTLKPGQRINKGDIIGYMGNCFDKETEILTSKGWFKFDNLPLGLPVATLNIENQQIQYQEPTAYIKKIYPEMLYFKNKDLDFAVSPDHRMLVKLHQDQKFKFIFAEKLPNRSYIKQSGMNWEGIEINDFILPERCYTRDRWGTKASSAPVAIKAEDWLEFLGWFLSDGCLQYNKKSSKYINVTITQSDNNKKLPILIDLLDRLPFNYFKAGNDYRISTRQVIEHLQRYGIKGEKKVPSFIFELSPRLIKCFLKGFFLGDGWVQKGTQYCVFGYHEKKLLDQIQQLVLLSGDWATYLEADNTKYNDIRPLINGKKVVVKYPHYVLTVRREQYTGIAKKQIIKKEYNDTAYCVSVPNQTVYVRRNGKPMWCGNSGSTYSNSGGTGSHLDYRIWNTYQKKYVNPYKYLETHKT